MKIRILLLILLFFSCNNEKKIDGKYLDMENKKIFDFKVSRLNVFNLIDSTEHVLNLKYSQSHINVKNETLSQSFKVEINNDKELILNSLQKKSVFDNRIILKKIKDEKIDVDPKIFDNYWGFWVTESPSDSIYYLIRIPSKYKNVGYLYRKVKNYDDGSFFRNQDDFYFLDRVYVSHKIFFNNFNFINFDYPLFNNAWFFVEDLSVDKVNLLGISLNKNLVFEKYENPNLVGYDRRFHD